MLIAGMPFAKDSIFLAQPLLLDVKQRRFLVGIRFAVETTQLSGRRLWAALERRHDNHEKVAPETANMELFADAWAIVDNARRLQRLLWKMPGVEDEAVAQGFVSRWPSLREMRDAMQHPDKDYSKNHFGENYVYGTLCWVDSRFRIGHGKVYAYVINAGPQANPNLNDSKFPFDVPIDSLDNIHSVVLMAGGVALSLDALLRDICETMDKLDSVYTNAIKNILDEQKMLYPERTIKLEKKAKTDKGFRLELTVNTSSGNAQHP
ncbi:hypothetical protein [Sphingomonas oleivorans]|uniref:hypothetical protein n=1 Tax=Sphingomonas oleivorans TaxID=1735121 RepID=UPI001057071B|nr:hypothetical protein [Sphingomonas oleivorans]